MAPSVLSTVLRQVGNNLQTRVFGLFSEECPNSESFWHKDDTYSPSSLSIFGAQLGILFGAPPSVSAPPSYPTTHRVLPQVSNLLQRLR
jgi:hypothetical protein